MYLFYILANPMLCTSAITTIKTLNPNTHYLSFRFMWPSIINAREEKNQLDATSTDVYSQLVNSQHVSGIIIHIVRRTDCINLRVVFAWLCWLRSCVAGTRAVRTVWKLVYDWPVVYQLSHSAYSSCPSYTLPQPTQPGKHHTQVYTVCSPDDVHNDARNMLRVN